MTFRLRQAWDVLRGRAEADYPEPVRPVDWDAFFAYLDEHPPPPTWGPAASRWAEVAMARAEKFRV